MAKTITTINTTQTFEDWLLKTNEMVSIFASDAVTVSNGTPAGDTTTGNATINGNFAATTLIASTVLNADSIASLTPSNPVAFSTPIEVSGASAVVATFSQASGAQTRYTDTALSWDVGLNGTDFMINTGVDPKKFLLSTAGTLTVPNIAAVEDITAGGDVTAVNFIGDGSQLTGVSATAALADLTDVSSTAPADGEVLKWSQTAGEWAPGVDVGSSGGGNADTLGGIAPGSFLRSDADDTASGDLTFTGELTLNKSSGTVLNVVTADVRVGGNLQVTDLRATGNVITKYSSSDIALKENLEIINNALDKVTQVNGYTFNYKNDPDERVSGVVAQEIEKVLPEVVFDHEVDNETYKAVRYDNIIPLLLEAIKELKVKVDDLESQLAK